MRFPGVEWDYDNILDEFCGSWQRDLILQAVRPLIDLSILVADPLWPEAPELYLGDRLVVSVMATGRVFVLRDFIDEI